jgi:hypothetical protein
MDVRANGAKSIIQLHLQMASSHCADELRVLRTRTVECSAKFCQQK